jgi:polar amino acid transport system substrate-binding protein
MGALPWVGPAVHGYHPYTMSNESILAALAPSGTLRAAINVGNPILAGLDETGSPRGVSVDIARELCRRLATPLECVVVDAAKKSVETVASGRADIGFFAVDPVRGADIAFTEPYVLIEGCYLVREDSPIRNNGEVDTPQTRVAAGAGSAYDLFLTRELKRAAIVRVPTSPAVVDAFIELGLEVAAGVKQQLQVDAARHRGLRLIEEPFMVIRQAMGIAKTRGDAAARYLSDFVDDLRASGFVREALARHGIQGATPG